MTSRTVAKKSNTKNNIALNVEAASPATLEILRDAILKVLDGTNDQSTKCLAIETIAKAVQGQVTVTGSYFTIK